MNEFRSRWRRIEKKMKAKTGGAARHLEATALLTDSWAILIKGVFVDADTQIAELRAKIVQLEAQRDMALNERDSLRGQVDRLVEGGGE